MSSGPKYKIFWIISSGGSFTDGVLSITGGSEDILSSPIYEQY
jgi:hypothetical protein